MLLVDGRVLSIDGSTLARLPCAFVPTPADKACLPKLVVVTGPTAAGKTGLAIRLAEEFGGEIVNADSMQVYRCLDIGTAKPSPADRARVRHHLIDVVAPDVQYNAGRYAADARAAVTKIHGRAGRVFLVGGTGLYIRALLEGLDAGVPSKPELRQRLEEEHARAREEGDPGLLHRRLADVDPASAERLHPHDLQRIVRALEIAELTGRPASAHFRSQASRGPRYQLIHLAIDPGPEALVQRIDARCERMIEAGLLREVRSLREKGFGPELPAMQAIGYRHMQPVIDGRDILANVLVAMKRDTRQLARRQRTWLRAVPSVRWRAPEDWRAIRGDVAAFLEEIQEKSAGRGDRGAVG